MIQNDKILSIEKAKHPENVIAKLYPDFPYVVCILQFFEKLSRYDIDLLNEIKNKRDFFKLFVGKRIEIFLHRAPACFTAIEFDFAHMG